jgi:hypothetical protein
LLDNRCAWRWSSSVTWNIGKLTISGMLRIGCSGHWLSFGAPAPRALERQVGVHDENSDKGRVARVVMTVQSRPEPVDVVVDDAGRCCLASVVEDDEY